MDILELVNPKDLLDFSQNFSVKRNYLGDSVFPDVKTPNLKAEFYRLSDQLMLPTMALVHAFDTEAHIGARPTMEKVKLEKFLIKEKINQSERVQYVIDNGADASSIVQYIFDDVARLSESVKTRTEVMKCEVLTSGKATISENGLSMVVDYGVPKENKTTLNLAAEDADFLGDLQKMVDKAKDCGQTISRVITSNKIVAKMRANKGIQVAIRGTLGAGAFVTLQQLNALMQEMYGFTLETYDERYRIENKKGELETKRYFDEDKLVGLSTLPNKSMGSGLWGVTPEEKAVGPWTEKSAQQYITTVMWKTPDPVATWTKSSGLFVPALPNPSGLFIATVTTA
jgi:hypothetical protein